MKSALFQLLLCIVVLALGGVALAALVNARVEVEPTPREVVVPAIDAISIELTPVTLSAEASGTVGPADQATVAAEIAGRIAAIADGLEIGARVERDDILFELDRRDLEIARTAAAASLAQARASLDRELAEVDIARRDLEMAGIEDPTPLARREPQLAMAEAAFESAEAALAKAELDLERTVLRAPFDGLVWARPVEVGQVVAPGTPLAQLAATAAYEVVLPLSAAEVGRLVPLGVGRTDGPAVALEATVDGREARFEGRVVRTLAELDPRTRTLGVVVRIDAPLADSRTPLRMGTFVHGTIEGRVLDAAAVIPPEALRGADELWIVDGDSRLVRRRVSVAQRLGSSVVIDGGLAAGEQVVVSELDVAIEGMAVDVAPPTAVGQD